jgi:hypothetical protein
LVEGRIVKAIAELILEIDAELTASGIRHAFGGALALAYYAEPRGTVDVDINVGVPYQSRSTLLDRLATVGWFAGDDAAEAVPAAGTRLHQIDETVVVDLFFAFDAYHEDVLDRAVVRPFLHAGERHELRFLSAEDLTVFKIAFGRSRDWADIEAMVAHGTTIDPDDVERRLVGFEGPTAYPAAARFRALARARPG